MMVAVLLLLAADRLVLWRRMVSGDNPKARFFLDCDDDWAASNDCDDRPVDREKILRATPNVAKAVTATVPPRRTEIPPMANMRAANRLHLRANDGVVFRLVLLIGERLCRM